MRFEDGRACPPSGRVRDGVPDQLDGVRHPVPLRLPLAPQEVQVLPGSHLRAADRWAEPGEKVEDGDERRERGVPGAGPVRLARFHNAGVRAADTVRRHLRAHERHDSCLVCRWSSTD